MSVICVLIIIKRLLSFKIKVSSDRRFLELSAGLQTHEHTYIHTKKEKQRKGERGGGGLMGKGGAGK